MSQFSIDRMYAIIADVLMLHDFKFRPNMSAADIPGWDSLNHSILMMELTSETGIDISAEETASIATIGELYDFIDSRLNQIK